VERKAPLVAHWRLEALGIVLNGNGQRIYIIIAVTQLYTTVRIFGAETVLKDEKFRRVAEHNR